MNMNPISLFAALAGFISLSITSGAQNEPMNGLFTSVDDLSPEMGCCGHQVVK